MLNEVFKEDLQNAKITIEIGDYLVTVEGDLEPPTVRTDRFEQGLHNRAWPRDPIIFNELSEILLKMRPKGNMVAKRFRWVIPLATKPRIEE